MTEQNKENAFDASNMTKKPTLWQRIRYYVVRWWLFTFRNETVWEFSTPAVRFRIRKYWLDIESVAKNHWNVRIGSNHYAYGFLLTVANDMEKAVLRGDVVEKEKLEKYFVYFAANLYTVSEFMLADVKFAKSLSKEIDWAVNRKMKQAAEESKKVTKEQEDTDQVFMEQAIERGKMNRQQRRKASREEKKAMKEDMKKIVRDLNKELDNEENK